MNKLYKVSIITLLAVVVRWCTSLNGYSGAGKPPMFGDYEAQRHWQEITVNLPTKEWYTNSTNNDLMYWGLDYPPLTAYHSYLCGLVARYINPDWVALNTSRGYESYEHKLFMRYSVLLVDVLIYFPAVYWIFSARKPNPVDPECSLKGYLLMLMYPGLILVDYGHFQYNCISLGLALTAVTSLATSHDVLGAALFCLALNYKQMELYHAMPFFCFLLGTCLWNIRRGGFFQLIKIGVTVILTFALCWFPFLYSIESAQHVLHRLFPFARGIFELFCGEEGICDPWYDVLAIRPRIYCVLVTHFLFVLVSLQDKVSNVWCSLSVVIKWQQVFTRDQVLKMCLLSTAACLVPSSLDLLIRPSIKKFRYSLVNSAMVFFLFSFQVHEKSILLAALIVCTLIPDHPLWSLWFLQVSTFSMLPLLIKDGVLVPFIALMIFYPILYYTFYPVEKDRSTSEWAVWAGIFTKLGFCISSVGQIVLTLATIIVPPPERLPDLFPLVISVFSCAHFVLFTLFFHYCQFTSNPASRNTQQQGSKQYTTSGTVKVSNKSMNAAKLENTTKNKGKMNKLKLRKKKHE